MWLLGGMTVYQIASGLPRNFAVHLTSLVSPINNRTFIAFDFERFKPKLYTTSVLASYSIPTFILFIVVLFGTIFLINSFKQSRKLRDSMNLVREISPVQQGRQTRSHGHLHLYLLHRQRHAPCGDIPHGVCLPGV